MDFDFDKTELTLMAGAFAALHADIQSTKKYLDNGGQEDNPLIGSHPSKKKLDAAGVLAAVAQVGSTAALPKRFRKPFLAGMIGMESAVAVQNQTRRTSSGFMEGMKKPLAIGLAAAIMGHYFLNDESAFSVALSGKPKIQVEMKF